MINTEYEAEKLETIDCYMLTIQCPHCQDYFEVKVPELNCMIFRHASFTPLNPTEGWINLSKTN